MTLAALLLATVLQDTAVFREDRLGLQFEHPKGWKVKRNRQNAVLTIPLDGGREATVMLFRARFKGSAEEWQLIQAEINRSLKRPVTRQWQEDYLGVPMLLTRSTYEQGGKASTAVVGLLYTAFEEKLHFRLEASSSDAEAAESAWRGALLTLRTTTGELPPTEDPNKPSVKPEPPKPTTVWKPDQQQQAPERGRVTLTLTVGTSTFRLYVPDGWKLDGDRLTTAGLRGTLVATAAVGLPEDAGKALLDAARGDLEVFDRVDLREDPTPVLARSGAVVGQVTRVGVAKGAPLVSRHVVGACEGVYWRLSYRVADASAYKADARLLDALARLLFAERG